MFNSPQTATDPTGHDIVVQWQGSHDVIWMEVNIDGEDVIVKLEFNGHNVDWGTPLRAFKGAPGYVTVTVTSRKLPKKGRRSPGSDSDAQRVLNYVDNNTKGKLAEKLRSSLKKNQPETLDGEGEYQTYSVTNNCISFTGSCEYVYTTTPSTSPGTSRAHTRREPRMDSR